MHARAAEAHELALLEHAQQLGLDRRRHLADLVEEQHAAVGLLDASRLGGDRAGERAALVAEQLRLEQLVGQRRAVDRDERPVAAARRVVDEPRHDFLAGARLAGQQHRGFGLRDARGLRQHVLPLLRVADDAPLAAARLELAGERGDLRLEPRRRLARLGIAARRLGQPLVRQRQRQVVGHAPREVDVVVAERVGLRATGRRASRRRRLPSGIGTRSADRTPKRREHAAAHAVGRDLGVDVVDDVGVAMEQRPVVAGQRSSAPRTPGRRPARRPARRRGTTRRRRPTRSAPGCRAAGRRGRRRRPRRRRAGCRAHSAIVCSRPLEAVDALAAQRLALDDARRARSASASRSATPSISDLMRVGERVVGGSTSATARRARARPAGRCRASASARRRRPASSGAPASRDAVAGDLDLARRRAPRTARPTRRGRAAARAAARTESTSRSDDARGAARRRAGSAASATRRATAVSTAAGSVWSHGT